jgi:hypothetical protein
MKIKQNHDHMFSVIRGGESKVLIKGGRVLIPRRRSFFVDDTGNYGTFPMTSGTTATEGNAYCGFLTINLEDRNITVRKSGKIYLKIVPTVDVSYSSDPDFNGVINIGTGSVEETIPDYGQGQLLFGKLMRKKFVVASFGNLSYVFQSEDPELDNHDESKSSDYLSFSDGIPEYTVATHILIAEIIVSGNTMTIRQRHRGPLIVREPLIYWGDFGLRENLS